ncbi:MAG TPA: O-antigen ligase family protein [Vicinamibacterales bacterium]
MYPSTLLVPAVLCAILAALCRPWTVFDGNGAVDRWLAVGCAVAFLQLMPLPAFVVNVLSPHDRGVWDRLSLAPAPSALPLSIDLARSARAALLGAGLLVIFISARRIFAAGGVRRVTRAIAAIGIVVSAIALAQDASAHGLMYWRWHPLQEGAPPFGPFVNRNHFGTWAILAVPLVLGYLAAHATAHHPAETVSWRRRLHVVLDGRTISLLTSVTLMIVALAASLSRSGVFGLGVALLTGALLRRRREGRAWRAGRWMIAAFALAAIAVVVRVDPAELVGRFAAAPISAAGRLVIWRDTLPVIRDFWLTGTGAGTYETAMLIYQRASVGVRFNQAHNQYLQLAAEGGLLLGIPVAIAIWRFVRLAAQSLAADDSGMYWLRAGAAGGLTGVAAQSIWETGLTTPANAALAAIVAAIVLHTPLRSGREG